MPDLPVSMATGQYEHLEDLVTGRVRPEGIKLTAMILPIEEIFYRTSMFAEWDVAEFSMAKYVSLTAAGIAPFRALPVFPSRVFRLSAFYVATAAKMGTAQDMAGKRVGIPEWSQTAGVYARAFLQHQCGVPLGSVRWFQGGVNQAGRQEKVRLSLPEGVTVQVVPDRSLNEMLLQGDLDAIITAREPAAFVAGDPRVQRLWPDYPEREESYFRDTRIFPIMHVVVVKTEVLERAPWVATNLFRAFEESKANSFRRLATIVNSAVPLPWLYPAFQRAQSLFGEDPWPYGLEANRTTLEGFCRFCAEQGVTQREVAVEELFPREVCSAVKV